MFRFSLPLFPEPHSFLLTEQLTVAFSPVEYGRSFRIVPVLSLLSSLEVDCLFCFFGSSAPSRHCEEALCSTSDFAIVAVPSPFRLHVFALCQTARSSRSYIRLRRHVDKRFICRHERKEGYKH